MTNFMMNLKAKKAAKEFKALIDSYNNHIAELIEQRNGWRRIVMDFNYPEEDRILARYNIVMITKTIAQLEEAREKVVESSL